jgi:hypothetical protein
MDGEGMFENGVPHFQTSPCVILSENIEEGYKK